MSEECSIRRDDHRRPPRRDGVGGIAGDAKGLLLPVGEHSSAFDR